MVDYYGVTLLTGVVGMNAPERRVLHFKEDSYGGTFYAQFYDLDGNEFDLTGGTATLRIRTPVGTVSTAIATFTTESATDGKAYLVIGSAFLATSGGYVGEFRVSSASKVDKSDDIPVLVRPSVS